MHHVLYFAYLDPGTGSLIIQSLIGAIAGIAVFGRKIFYSIKLKLTGKKPDTAAKTDASSKTDKANSTTPTDDTKK
jgi:hypothetical protein